MTEQRNPTPGGRGQVSKLAALFRSRDFIFLLALVLGVLAPGAARPLLPLVLPTLGGVMTLATMGVALGVAGPRARLAGPALAGIFLSYGLLSGLFLVASRLSPPGSYLDHGFLALALAPPAVAVIPFTEFFRGDRAYSLVGTVAAHLAGLVLAPLIALASVGPGVARPTSVAVVLVQLVLLPLAAGRVLARTPLAPRIAPWRGLLTNWGFFLVIYATTGANRDLLVGDLSGVAVVGAAGVASTFGMALVVRAITRFLGVPRPVAASAILLGSLKNYGVAAAVALEFFGERAAVPAVVCGAVMIPYAVWLGRHFRVRAGGG